VLNPAVLTRHASVVLSSKRVDKGKGCAIEFIFDLIY